MKRIWITFLFLFSLGKAESQTLDERFHTFDEIQSLMADYDSNPQYESIFRVDTIGYSSLENLPILAAIISDNITEKEDEPRHLFVGQVHAEELLGVEAVIELLDQLLNPVPAQFLHVLTLRQMMEIWIIPTMNPEGMNVVFSGEDVTYRKNKTDFSPDGLYPNGVFDYSSSIGNDIDGVDINRNFDFNWVFGDTFLEPDPSGYGSHYDYFRGSSPFSESETRALRDLAIEQQFQFSIVMHSSRSGNLSEKVFTSWEWEDTKQSPDHFAQITIGDHMANMIPTEDGTGEYLSISSKSRNGKAHDWFYSQTGCFQYLIECGTANLQPDSALIEDTIERNIPAMYYLMDRSIGYNTDAAQISGVVFNTQDNQPIDEAIVELVELSGNVLTPRKTDEFGRYRRIVNPGTYTVKVRHPNYHSDLSVITANNSVIRTHNVALSEKSIYTVSVNIINDNSISSVEPLLILTNGIESDTVALAVGSQTISLREDTWLFTLVDQNIIPIQKTIYINQNTTINLTFDEGTDILSFIPDDEQNWEIINGDWVFGDGLLRTQNGFLYTNSDTLESISTLEMPFFPTDGVNRVVCTIDHKYELEWDVDSIRVLLISNNGLFSSNSYSNHSWTSNQLNYITLTNQAGIDSVKLRLEFYKDETVNYCGWEVSHIKIQGINDQYLGIANSTENGITYQLPSVSTPYPNPSNGTINLDLYNWGTNPEIILYNLLGQEVFREKISEMSPQRHHWTQNIHTLSQVQLATGVYFIKVQNPERTIIKKCVLLRN
ncbi:MAG: T9SS type A sorting domain-containing protein [Candidatus Marinimicrobia bacterium]|nr:T9SS type A sorting domain-containing protein [Candidatus Neomarinimicrobiota bacterium]